MDQSKRGSTVAQGFTLIELLVVIGIIGILIALSLAAGSKVVNGAKGASTTETLRVLQQSTEAYIDQRDELPPPYAELNLSEGIAVALSDAPPISPNDPYYASGTASGYSADILKQFQTTPNGLSWYIYQVQQMDKASGASQIIDSISSKVRTTQLNDARASENPVNGSLEGTENGPPNTGWKTVRVYDAWGRQIRFVHPRLDGEYGIASNGTRSPVPITDLLGFPPSPYTSYNAPAYPGGQKDLTKIARSGAGFDPGDTGEWKGNSDGGSCIGNRPYFYSEGQDGKAFTSDDNLYANKPRLPSKK